MTEETKKIVQAIVAAGHRTVDGEVPLGQLIKKRKELGLEVSPASMDIVKNHYQLAASLRELAALCQYEMGGSDWYKCVVDVESIYNIANSLEELN
jgi:hypothetical protein